jgi:hypothetical protein
MRIFVLTATYELRVSRKATYVTTLPAGLLSASCSLCRTFTGRDRRNNKNIFFKSANEVTRNHLKDGDGGGGQESYLLH